jgi:predicted aspartyl protease
MGSKLFFAVAVTKTARFLGTRASVLLIMYACLGATISRGAVTLDTIGAFLTRHGYGGAQLVDSGQFYHLPVRANGKTGNLVVDTGAPATLIFRSSLHRFGLAETKTNAPASGAFGRGHEAYGVSTIGSLSAGNCTLANVPVVVTSDVGNIHRYGTPSGFLGLRELVKFGAILDLSHRMVYFRPARPDRELPGALRTMLEGAGWKPVQLSLRRHHLRVPGEIDDVPCRFIVDTGARLTALDRTFALRAKLGGKPTGLTASGIGRSGGTVSVTSFASLWIGNYQIKRGSATVINLDPEMLARGTDAEVVGLIGVEYLAQNSAIFDFVSGTLYLRPGSRTGTDQIRRRPITSGRWNISPPGRY